MKRLRAAVIVSALAAAVVGLLAGCNQSATETADQVVAAIQKACAFTTTAQQVEAIALQIAAASGVDPATVSVAAISLNLANNVVNNVCSEVKKQTENKLLAAAPRVQLGADGSRTITVVVDGVTVVGVWTPPKG